MSVRAMTAAWDAGVDLGLSPPERLILLRLGDAADDFGYSWLGVDDLSLFVGVDRRTIQRHLRNLVAARAVDRVVAGGGRGRPALYRVLPMILDDSTDAPGRRRYEKRFRISTADKQRQNAAVSEPRNGGTRTAKQRHQTRETVTPVSPDTKGTQTNRDLEPLELPIRGDGESWENYIKRTYPPPDTSTA